MSRLEWKNVSAPDFTAAARLRESAGRSFDNALDRIGNSFTGYENRLKDEADNAVLRQMMQFQDPESYKNALASGQLMLGVNPNLVRIGTLDKMNSWGNTLLDRQAKGLEHEVNIGKFQDTQAAKEWMANPENAALFNNLIAQAMGGNQGGYLEGIKNLGSNVPQTIHNRLLGANDKVQTGFETGKAIDSFNRDADAREKNEIVSNFIAQNDALMQTRGGRTQLYEQTLRISDPDIRSLIQDRIRSVDPSFATPLDMQGGGGGMGTTGGTLGSGGGGSFAGGGASGAIASAVGSQPLDLGGELVPVGSSAPSVGIKNKNYSNLKGNGWVTQMPGYKGNDASGHAIFETVEQGNAAGLRQLTRYFEGTQATGGKPLTTPDSIIRTWAKPGSRGKDGGYVNDAEKAIGEEVYKNYLNHVTQRAGFKPDQQLTKEDLPKLLAAMQEFETGARYQNSPALATTMKAKVLDAVAESGLRGRLEDAGGPMYERIAKTQLSDKTDAEVASELKYGSIGGKDAVGVLRHYPQKEIEQAIALVKSLDPTGRISAEGAGIFIQNNIVGKTTKFGLSDTLTMDFDALRVKAANYFKNSKAGNDDTAATNAELKELRSNLNQARIAVEASKQEVDRYTNLVNSGRHDAVMLRDAAILKHNQDIELYEKISKSIAEQTRILREKEKTRREDEKENKAAQVLAEKATNQDKDGGERPRIVDYKHIRNGETQSEYEARMEAMRLITEQRRRANRSTLKPWFAKDS